MVQAIQEVVPLAEVAHVGLRRDQATLRSDVYLNRLPAGPPPGVESLVCDPMLATGGLARSRCVISCLIAGRRPSRCCASLPHSPDSRQFTRSHRDLPIFCAAIDPVLNDVGFIVPGLGDAGDRLFGPPD